MEKNLRIIINGISIDVPDSASIGIECGNENSHAEYYANAKDFKEKTAKRISDSMKIYPSQEFLELMMAENKFKKSVDLDWESFWEKELSLRKKVSI